LGDQQFSWGKGRGGKRGIVSGMARGKLREFPETESMKEAMVKEKQVESQGKEWKVRQAGRNKKVRLDRLPCQDGRSEEQSRHNSPHSRTDSTTKLMEASN
jgi:hypothetical protein